MSDTTATATKSLSKGGGTVRDVKFYYRPGCTKADLDDFRQKAWAQINSGRSTADTNEDW